MYKHTHTAKALNSDREYALYSIKGKLCRRVVHGDRCYVAKLIDADTGAPFVGCLHPVRAAALATPVPR